MMFYPGSGPLDGGKTLLLSGHGTKSSILYLHSPGVRPKVIVCPSGHPLIRDSLSSP